MHHSDDFEKILAGLRQSADQAGIDLVVSILATWPAADRDAFLQFSDGQIAYENRQAIREQLERIYGQDQLEKVTEHFKDFIRARERPVPATSAPPSLPNSNLPAPTIPRRKNQVFVIHGRDYAARAELEFLLLRVGVEPIILDEQSNRGQSLDEKLGRYKTVAYAIAIITPDDVGRLNQEGEPLRPRARQNVIYELGYFKGALDPSKVCGLIKSAESGGEIELPSDFGPVTCIDMDAAGEWKRRICKELQSAGLSVDLTRAA